jgi:exopolyphosphatase/guanosine-5'-triphosphate,3'-diphosphate pyrophosphatase
VPKTEKVRATHASIDIGSNTLRLLIARPSERLDSHEPWETVDYAHRITRLGQGLHKSGQLSDAGMERAMQAMQTFKTIIEHHQVEPKQVYAVATAAVREAKNGNLFQQRVFEKTGITISIIDGEHEAATSLLGAASVLHAETRNDMLLFDIGGGSTEFIRAKDGHITDAISCKLGVVRLVESCLHSDPPSIQDYQAMKEAAHTHLINVQEHWQKTSTTTAPIHMVGTAGTVTTLAAIEMNLVPYDAKQVNNYQIHQNVFTSLRDGLLTMNHEQRQNIPAVETGRADLIIAGLAIIEAIMEKWNYSQFVTVDAGLLEGNWLASYEAESK